MLNTIPRLPLKQLSATDDIWSATLEIDLEERVSAVSGNVEEFFGPIYVGSHLIDALVMAEKYGIYPAKTAAQITDAISKGTHQYLCEMRDGRSVLISAARENGNLVKLTFSDVTFVVKTALSQQKDVLTGLANRLALLERLNQISRPSSSAALLYLDLDRFKAVNDTLGHPIGDALLKLVSERMARLLGPDDLLARVGGDEFVILLAHGDQPLAAAQLARKIIEIVGRTYLVKGHSIQVGASVGIAFAASDGDTPENLIRNADLALFKAKAGGRGSFRFFTDAMHEEVQARRTLEIDLRRALVLQEFSLVYQPQFKICGNRLVGFEALIRWNSSTRGNVSPAVFIPLAEETGVIEALGEWVLRSACNQAASWSAPYSISVNLSPLQFRNPKLVELIVSALATSGLAAHRLELEITEGALIENTDVVVAMLTQLKHLGIKVSIDDFGTGYSSLSYLQKFPFDKIKIDQSFVRNLEHSADSAAIVRAVTALGKSLNMATIAEGVETESQLRQIAKEGCSQVQGYLTGRPMSAAAATDLISRNL